MFESGRTNLDSHLVIYNIYIQDFWGSAPDSSLNRNRIIPLHEYHARTSVNGNHIHWEKQATSHIGFFFPGCHWGSKVCQLRAARGTTNWANPWHGSRCPAATNHAVAGLSRNWPENHAEFGKIASFTCCLVQSPELHDVTLPQWPPATKRGRSANQSCTNRCQATFSVPNFVKKSFTCGGHRGSQWVHHGPTKIPRRAPVQPRVRCCTPSGVFGRVLTLGIGAVTPKSSKTKNTTRLVFV